MAHWLDLTTGEPVTHSHHTTDGLGFDGQTIDHALRLIRSSTHPTTIDPDGHPIARRTKGLVHAAPTIETSTRLMGRESRGWRDDRTMLNQDTHITYDPTPTQDELKRLRERFRAYGGAVELATASGIPVRTARDFLNGAHPKPVTWAKLRTASSARW